MALPGKEPIVADVLSLTMECTECGRTRRKAPTEMRAYGVTPETKLSDLSHRLVCSICKDEGVTGGRIVVQAAFATDLARERANAYRVNAHEARGSAPRARRA